MDNSISGVAFFGCKATLFGALIVQRFDFDCKGTDVSDHAEEEKRKQHIHSAACVDCGQYLLREVRAKARHLGEQSKQHAAACGDNEQRTIPPYRV